MDALFEPEANNNMSDFALASALTTTTANGAIKTRGNSNKHTAASDIVAPRTTKLGKQRKPAAAAAAKAAASSSPSLLLPPAKPPKKRPYVQRSAPSALDIDNNDDDSSSSQDEYQSPSDDDDSSSFSAAKHRRASAAPASPTPSNASSSAIRAKGTGRGTGKKAGKHSIRLINKETNRLNVFYKRKHTLINKAHELSLLTNASVMTVVETPGSSASGCFTGHFAQLEACKRWEEFLRHLVLGHELLSLDFRFSEELPELVPPPLPAAAPVQQQPDVNGGERKRRGRPRKRPAVAAPQSADAHDGHEGYDNSIYMLASNNLEDPLA